MKRPLIIGNALLFAACLTSCDDEAPEDPGLIDCGCVEDQFMNLPDEGRDDMAVADMAEADMSVALDMAPEGDMSQPDMAVEGDMMAEVDMSQPDMAEPDMAEPDMAEPDMAEPDMAEPDMAEPDMMVEADMGGDACEALVGEPCENNFNEGCCDSMGNAIVLCQAGTFQRINPADELFCNCFGDGEPPVEVACAVPGFVGVHVSGWRPARVMRLRRVA